MTELPPAGWYDDPDGTTGLRHWDGQNWTDNIAAPSSPTDARPPAKTSRAKTVGIVALVLVTAVIGYLVLGLLGYWFA